MPADAVIFRLVDILVVVFRLNRRVLVHTVMMLIALVVDGEAPPAGRERVVVIERLRLVVHCPNLVVFVVEVFVATRMRCGRVPNPAPVDEQKDDNPDDDDDRYSDAEAYDQEQLLHRDDGA